VLLGVGAKRFSATKKFMPAGLMATLGAVGVGYYFYKYSKL
jgi:uncharacterized membrane protein (UPF0136 family)